MRFDIPTLTRLQIYVLTPAALIWFPSAAKLPLSTSWPVVWFSLGHFAFLYALGWIVAKLLGMSRNVAGLMALAAMFSNSGNYGIPLIQLTFPDDYLLYQTVILSIHSILVVPLVLLALSRPDDGGGHIGIWRTLFGTPLLPAAALGFILKGFSITLPQVLAVPIRLTSEAFTPMALLLLGVQLAAIRGRVERKPLVVGLVLRMIVAPATAWLFACAARLSAQSDCIPGGQRGGAGRRADRDFCRRVQGPDGTCVDAGVHLYTGQCAGGHRMGLCCALCGSAMRGEA